ncbi:MAG: M28 family peptidase, partial [SAR202 cluster bacterium]|nr:M28 family peptidase [SAR202 cluster bacterium]
MGFAVVLTLLFSACNAGTPSLSTPAFTAEPIITATATPVLSSPVLVDAFAVLERFLVDLGPRKSATEGELAAEKYMAEHFGKLGHETAIQPFTVKEISLDGRGLTLDTPQPKEFVALPMANSGLRDVSGVLTDVGLALPGDIPEGGLEEMIAFARRGGIIFQKKADNVIGTGAVGLVVYNNVGGNFRGTLASQPAFPVISLSWKDGQPIADLLEEGEISASITLLLRDKEARNVIAEKEGTGDAIVVIGGHYDSVPDIPGANDNASGAAILLAIAEALAEVDLPFTLRFIAFGSGELGLLGSEHYVGSLTEDELSRTKAMFNMDAVGSGDGASMFGDEVLAGLVDEVVQEIGVTVTVRPGLSGGSSDYASFQTAGMPFLMFFGDDFSRIHTDRDRLEFVQPELLRDVTDATVALMQSRAFDEW